MLDIRTLPDPPLGRGLIDGNGERSGRRSALVIPAVGSLSPP